MGWINSRLARARRFSGVVSGLVIGGVALVTALAFWWSKLGAWGVGVVGGLIVLCFVASMLMPGKTWDRLTADPAAAARSGAIEALQERLAESDALRRRLFDELPDAESMVEEANLWLEKAQATVITHAPEYRADFESASSTPFGLYIVPGKDLSMDQQKVLRAFDHRREILAGILDKVRGR